jgi:glutaredoxin
MTHQSLNRVLGALFVMSALSSACLKDLQETTSSTSSSTSQSGSQSETPSLIEVRDESKSLLFIYQDENAQEHRVTSIKEIPITSRERVFVLDLKASPTERRARQFIQIFDLRTPRADGTYPGEVVPRIQIEQKLRKNRRAQQRKRAEELKRAQLTSPRSSLSKDAQAQPPITLYSTSWCGYCKKMRAFLKKQNFKFTELDIERDRAAARALKSKSARAGLTSGGVPITDVGGQLVSGFDPQRVLSLIAQHQQRAPTPPQ